ncbi:unnamed protein product [Cylicocyclus nassatus]|uniref:Uncharacterized protein n=1 Tax=Cylicocyclus nassatus TaxID=53992 RepID=A0AA36HBK1_CYLNA|nr:unnamed protein product [Cylicocyclus nassatus]
MRYVPKSNASRPHLILGIDSEITNKGFIFARSERRGGLEREQCATLMKALNWSYEFVDYHNDIGHIYENGTITGMLGDVYEGRIDMVCGRFRMTTERLKYLKFAYPINVSVKQVYLIREPVKKQDMGFMLMPFEGYLWIFLALTIVIVTLVLMLLRYIEFWDKNEAFTKSSSSAVWHLISYSTNFTIEPKPSPTYISYWGIMTLWMLVWTHVFVAYYTSELRGMLIFSITKKLPFDDFDGLVESLEEGSYRFIGPSPQWRPECPDNYTQASCTQLFDRIFAKNPPVIASTSQLTNDTFVNKFSVPLVGVEWYETERLGGNKIAIWTKHMFHSEVWLITDFSVSPASLIVSKNFPYLEELNLEIIKLQTTFIHIRARYTPTYPRASLIEYPKSSAFNFTQLSSVFYIYGILMVFSCGILVAEISYDRIQKARHVQRAMVALSAVGTMVTGYHHRNRMTVSEE